MSQMRVTGEQLARCRESTGPRFGELKVIESKQRQECFDCGNIRQVYALQGGYWMNSDGEGGRFWAPTCRQCYREHKMLEAEVLEGQED